MCVFLLQIDVAFFGHSSKGVGGMLEDWCREKLIYRFDNLDPIKQCKYSQQSSHTLVSVLVNDRECMLRAVRYSSDLSVYLHMAVQPCSVYFIL